MKTKFFSIFVLLLFCLSFIYGQTVIIKDVNQPTARRISRAELRSDSIKEHSDVFLQTLDTAKMVSTSKVIMAAKNDSVKKTALPDTLRAKTVTKRWEKTLE
ncbi:MAG: hypothetical protein LBH32_00635 [Dysgonamonadaceae bacterium]|jgi:hypothetical protein|nr:hypothetical protein [Dysgonamonadaceae bacterium]